MFQKTFLQLHHLPIRAFYLFNVLITHQKTCLLQKICFKKSVPTLMFSSHFEDITLVAFDSIVSLSGTPTVFRTWRKKAWPFCKKIQSKFEGISKLGSVETTSSSSKNKFPPNSSANLNLRQKTYGGGGGGGSAHHT